MKCPICNDLRLPNLHVKRRMKDLPKKHAKIPTADQMYIDFAQLSESAKSGCLYCALLIDGVRRFFPNRIIYCMDLFWDGYCTITIQNPQDGEPYPHYLEFYRDDRE